MSHAEPKTPSPVDELAELRKASAARAEQAQAEEDARELEELRLEERLSGELGKRGHDFEIVNTPFGVWAVRKPDAQGIAQYDRAATEIQKGGTADRIIGILRHYVIDEPKQLDFHRVAAERPGVAIGANSVGAAFQALTGASRFDAKKK